MSRDRRTTITALALSALVHMLLFLLLSEPVSKPASLPATQPLPIIRAQLIFPTANPKDRNDKDSVKSSEPSEEIETPITQDSEPEPKQQEKPLPEETEQLSEETEQQIKELLKKRTTPKADDKIKSYRRYIPDSLSTANLPKRLRNDTFPADNNVTREKRRLHSQYPKNSPIAEEIPMGDGTSIIKMKSGNCVLVQDQSQLDPELQGKMWLHYGGCKKEESLAWKAFKQRMAKYRKN